MTFIHGNMHNFLCSVVYHHGSYASLRKYIPGTNNRYGSWILGVMHVFDEHRVLYRSMVGVCCLLSLVQGVPAVPGHIMRRNAV